MALSEGPSSSRSGRRAARSVPRAVLHQGMFAAANGRFLRLLGYQSFADLQAIPFLDLVPSARRSEVKTQLLRAEKAELPEGPAEICLKASDGDAIPVLARYERLRVNDEDCLQITLSPARTVAPSSPLQLTEVDSQRLAPALRSKHGQDDARPRRDRIQAICDSIVDHNRVLLIASALFAAFFLLFLPRLKFINNVDSFTLNDSPDVQFYQDFKRTFGDDEFFVIAFKTPDIFTAANLKMLQDITRQLEKVPEARRVRSIANVDAVRGAPGTFDVEPLMRRIPKTAEEIARLRVKATQDPLYSKSLISTDGTVASIIISTRYRPNDDDYRQRLLDEALKVLKPYQEAGTRFALAGWTVTNFSLSAYMQSDVSTFMPLTYAFIILTMWLVFRNKWILLLGTLNISVCLGATLGVLGLTGITVNPVTTITIPLTLALSLFDTIHIFSNMDVSILQSSADRYQALKRVLRLVFWPCLFTTITTAVGFLSLALDRVPVMREFAWAATSGMVFEWIYAFGLLPGLILLFPGKVLYQNYYNRDVAAGGALMDHMLEAVHRFLVRRHRAVLAATALLVAVAVPYIPKIPVETNLIEYFKTSSPVRQDVEFIERHLTGSSSIDVSFRTKTPDAIKEPGVLAVIDRIEQHLKSIPGIDFALSITDFLKEMNQGFHDGKSAYYRLPDTRNLAAQYLLLYDGTDINDFVNTSYDQARIAARSSIHGSDRQRALIDKLQNFIDETPHPGVDIRVTGRAVQDVDTVEALVNGQVASIAVAFFIISILMGVSLRSVRLGLLSLIPNSIPIVLNFGLMGALGMALNNGTALIASVAIGIAVDNTVHFLTQYQMKRAEGWSIVESVRSGLKVKGRAMIASTIIVCIGFGVLLLASFVPTIYFGLLNTLIMILALLADAIVLPSLVLLRAGLERRQLLGQKA